MNFLKKKNIGFIQFIKQQKIEREPYTGEVMETSKSVSNGDSKISPKNQTAHNNTDLAASGFHNRPATRAGPQKKNKFSFFIVLD